MTKWIGDKPQTCQVCHCSLRDKAFADARLAQGSQWAILCLRCLATHGVGTGTGRGQVYDTNGTKVEG